MNIRGSDANYSPIVNSYILIDKYKNIKSFCDLKKISQSFRSKFKKIDFLDIKNVVKFSKKLKKKNFLLIKILVLIFEKIIS